MSSLKQILFTFVFALALSGVVTAQDTSNVIAQRSAMTITSSASADRIRITAPSSIVQMHVEVYGASGEKLFDNEIRGGNVFDWHLQDGQAQRLPAGDYLCESQSRISPDGSRRRLALYESEKKMSASDRAKSHSYQHNRRKQLARWRKTLPGQC